METLVEKVVKGKDISDTDLGIELYEICDRVHAHCDPTCPVYRINGGAVHPNDSRYGCSCFKNGQAMLEFIRNN